MRAGTGFDEEDLKTELAERQIKRRKTMIQKILLSKRNPSAHQKTPEKIQNFFVQEGNEVEELIPEEPEEKDITKEKDTVGKDVGYVSPTLI